MIGVATTTRSIDAFARYLTKGRSGAETERVAWSESRNLPTNEPELAGKIMRATASQSARVQKPGYHLVLSFHPEDTVDRATIEGVADRTIAALGLAAHQALIVCHRDRPHAHVHLLINRVHPETGRAWRQWFDYVVLQKVLLDEEIALGLRITAGHLGFLQRNLVDFGLTERARLTAAHNHAQAPPPRRGLGSARMRFTLTEVLRSYIDVHSRVLSLNREQYKIELETDAARLRATRLDDAPEGAKVSRISGPRANDSALAAARAELEQAQSRGVAIRRDLGSLPDRAQLEGRIVRLLDRMSPNELRQLQGVLSPPQLALTSKLKSVIRDAALGRDEFDRSL
jgi:hypothetical protein